MAGAVFGAANVARFVTRPTVASKSITVQYGATNWTLVDSVRLLQAGDSSCSAVQAVGEVVLAPGQKGYFGFGHTKGSTAPDVDTFVVAGNPYQPGVKTVRIPFTFRYNRNDSVAVNDTFYFVGASGDSRPLQVYNATLSVQTGMPNSSGKLAERF